jgi:hypothetical protein
MTVLVDDPFIAGMAIRRTCRCTSPAGGCASSIPNVRVLMASP